MIHQADSNIRPEFDKEIQAIADFVLNDRNPSAEAWSMARYCLLDSLGCMALAWQYPACQRLLGPVISGTHVPIGSRVPGSSWTLDPIQGAFNIGTLIRWLDYNDTWLAQEWSHPSDNLGGILAVADYLSNKEIHNKQEGLSLASVLKAMIQAYEIQGILALKNSFNARGLDHVILVKIATTAVTAKMLGASRDQLLNAISQAWLDGHSLRVYRHAPNTGSRKSWAAGDATSRGVRLAWLSCLNEMGYPSALTVPNWGFQDVYFKGEALQRDRDYNNYVMENILFKVAYPAEFHAQTAVESALKLHETVVDRLDTIKEIQIETQLPAVKIISKEGPLHNPADRDHCLQYMIAIPLIYGNLTAEHYEDVVAKDPRIDILRAKMLVKENPEFTTNYYEENKRAFANSIQIFFEDGSYTDKVRVDYPLGHAKRRVEAIPLIWGKAKNNLETLYSKTTVEKILKHFENTETLAQLSLNELMTLLEKK